MPLTFKKAPLAELIAEVKWAAVGLPDPQQGARPGILQFQVFNTSAFEEFYMRFGALVHAQGFTVAERIMPPGFPAPPFQVVYRYKGAKTGKEILQVGPGVFSANALRPYQSWHVFRPAVMVGLNALLEARPESEKDAQFTSVSLRYINSFTPDLTGGRDTATFVRDVLGIKTDFPKPIADLIAEGASPVPSLTFAFPTTDGLGVQLTVADGIVEGGPSIVLDLYVYSTGPTAATADATIGALDAARNLAHGMFIGLTKSINTAMEPEGTDDR